jgi:hypothetical protein
MGSEFKIEVQTSNVVRKRRCDYQWTYVEAQKDVGTELSVRYCGG